MPNLLDPFVPSGGDPWDARKAAHLLRRAGFGATPAEIASYVGDGSDTAFNAAVDSLIDYPDVDAALDTRISSFGGAVAAPSTPIELAAHWYFRMRFTSAPLQEQLTFFFHDHFATEFEKIRMRVQFPGDDTAAEIQKATDILRVQNYLFRTEGIKDFRSLLIAETRDPAMLLYLDNWQNIAGRPQENYSRELMELFAMGPFNLQGQGNYTENDVRELARILTGESLDAGGSASVYNYMYRQPFHDTNPKTLFGNPVNVSPGNLETEYAIDLILATPAAPEFMAYKFISWFVTHEPDHDAVAELAAELSTNGFVIREALRKLFKSQYFYDNANFFALYKTPVDFAVHLIRQVELDETQLANSSNWTILAQLVSIAGLTLFAPPNVGGWIHGEAWVNSVNMINRYNFADIVSWSTIMTPTLVQSYFPDYTLATDADIRDGMRDRLVQDTLRPEEQAILDDHIDFINTSLPGPSLADSRYFLKTVGMAHLMSATPKFHLK